MNTGIFDVLTNSICDYLAILGHSVHFHLLGVLHEFAYHHGVLLGYIGSQLEESFQFILVGTYIHGSTTQYVGRTNKYRESHSVYEGLHILHGGQSTPFRLVHTYSVQHSTELISVLSIVNILGLRTQDRYTLCIQLHSQIVRNLSTCTYHYTFGTFQVQDIHHTFEGQFIKIQPVAHVIVCGYRLRIIVDHHTSISFLANGVKCLNTTPVKLYR